MKKQFVVLIVLCIFFSSPSYSAPKGSAKKEKPAPVVKDTIALVSQPLITFVELGSVRCIPCKAMQKVMKAVEEKYGSQIKIVFYDVWIEEQAHYAQDYNIRLIPTQVFLDANGRELMRHEGFFPEKEIDAFLQSHGLKPKSVDKG